MKKTDHFFKLDGFDFSADFTITGHGIEIEKAELIASHDFHIEVVKDEQLQIIKAHLSDEFYDEIEELRPQEEWEDAIDAAERAWEAKNDY